MAAPIYSQADADHMMAMPKVIEFDAWANRLSGSRMESNPSIMIEASPEDGNPRFRFRVEMSRNDRNDSFSIMLKGKIDNRPWEGLCRYDIQDIVHENNPNCCPGAEIDAGVFHRHVYSEESCRHLEKWDGCAEVVHLDPSGSFEQQLVRLRGRFLDDMALRFSDSNTANALFGRFL